MSAVYSFDQKDSSQLAQNPLAGLLSGGFTFSPVRSYGGSGNYLSATPTATATLTPTQSNTTSGPAMAPAVPFSDGLLGFGGGAALSATPATSILLPLSIFGAAFLLAVSLRK